MIFFRKIFSLFNYLRCLFYGKYLFNSSIRFIGRGITVQGNKKKFIFSGSVSIQDEVFIQSDGDIYIGDKSIIKRNAYIVNNNGKLIIGKNTAIGKRAEISLHGGNITIGNNVRIASCVFITNANHAHSDFTIPITEQGIITKDVIIADDVWIGHGAIILPGISIGKGSIIAAGSIVTKNVHEYSIVGGNPAKILRSRK